MNADGGGNSVAPLQPAAAAHSQTATTTAHGARALRTVAPPDRSAFAGRAPAAGAPPSSAARRSMASAQCLLQDGRIDDLRRRLQVAELHHVGDCDLHALDAALGD